MYKQNGIEVRPGDHLVHVDVGCEPTPYHVIVIGVTETGVTFRWSDDKEDEIHRNQDFPENWTIDIKERSRKVAKKALGV